MGIEVRSEIRVLNQEEFHTLNHRILGMIFEIHNEFGRFLDELLFKAEIAARCHDAGIIPAEREVRILVTHETFHKEYSVDLLFGSGLPFEVKAAETLGAAHRAQALNYLLLLGVHHGSLVNLRPERVQHEFISSQLTPELRRRVNVVNRIWQGDDKRSLLFRERMIAMLADWGAFLEVALYREAITYFLGGETTVVRPVPILSGERQLGYQKMYHLDEETAFAITAVTDDPAKMARQHVRLLSHTRLKRLQWINLNHHRIEFSTIINNGA